MAAKNDITGDSIQTRTVTETYRNNYDLIFGKKKKNDPSTSHDAVRDVHTPSNDSNTAAPDNGEHEEAVGNPVQ